MAMTVRPIDAAGAIGGLTALTVTTWIAAGGATGPATTAAAAVASVALAAFAWTSDTPEAPTRHRRRWGAALRIGGAAALCAGLYAVAATHTTPTDWTREQRFEPSDAAIDALAKLERPVSVYVVFPDGDPGQHGALRAADRIAAYSEQVRVVPIDPIAQPTETSRLDAATHSIVVESGSRREHLAQHIDPSRLAAAVERAHANRKHVLCWSADHGELDPDDTRAEGGAGAWAVGLELANYTIRPVSLLAAPVPDACDVVVLARPRSHPSEHELAAWRHWLGSGRTLILLDDDTPDPWTTLVDSIGIRVGAKPIADPVRPNRLLGIDDPYVLVLGLREQQAHPLTAHLRGAVAVQAARPLDARPSPQDLQVRAALNATEVVLPGASEPARPTVVMTSEGGRGQRAVVWGDADAATNRWIDFAGNASALTGSVAWLVDESPTLGDRAPSKSDPLAVTDAGAGALRFGALLGGPGLCLGMAVVQAARRRRRSAR